MGWVLAGVFLVGMFIFLLFSRVYIRFSVIYGEQRRSLTVTFRLFGIRFLTKEIDMRERKLTNKKIEAFDDKSLSDKMEELQGEIKNFSDMIRDTGTTVQQLLAILSIHRLKWHSRIGTGKADTTGAAIGGVWTTKYLLLGILDNQSHVRCTPSIDVTPEFNRKCLISETECMVSARIGKAIHALIKVMQKSSFRKRETLMSEGGR